MQGCSCAEVLLQGRHASRTSVTVISTVAVGPARRTRLARRGGGAPPQPQPQPPLPPTGALLPPVEVLTKLRELTLSHTQISDAGCAALAAAFDRGALPECNKLNMTGNSASAAAKANLARAVTSSDGRRAEPSPGTLLLA